MGLGGIELGLGLDNLRKLRMYLITENELLPAVGPHHLLHVTTDHGQGEAL